jgi:hypothetical protein
MSHDAIDLPQIWQKPPFETLLASLKGLEQKPRTWSAHKSDEHDHPAVAEDARVHDRVRLARYLSSVIKSRLDWITDEDQKDMIWTEASRRISERSGRAGKLLLSFFP